MRKAILLGLIVGILVVIPSQAEILKISIGASQANVIWQTSPAAFAEITRWGGVSLAVLFRSITLSGAITVVDFETMRIEPHPSFSIGGDIKLAQLGITSLHVSVGVVITPHVDWIGWSTGVALAISPVPVMEIRTGMGVETTKGASGYPPGMCIFFSFGAYASWPLF